MYAYIHNYIVRLTLFILLYLFNDDNNKNNKSFIIFREKEADNPLWTCKVPTTIKLYK